MSASSVLIIVVLLLAGYGGFELARRLLTGFRLQRLGRRQEKSDEKEHWTYAREHAEIRAKFDPDGKWHEATLLPAAYVAEMRDLNLRHGGMLKRRNGWTDDDFAEVRRDA